MWWGSYSSSSCVACSPIDLPPFAQGGIDDRSDLSLEGAYIFRPDNDDIDRHGDAEQPAIDLLGEMPTMDTRLHHQEVQIAVWTCLATCRRPEENDPLGFRHGDDAPNDLVQVLMVNRLQIAHDGIPRISIPTRREVGCHPLSHRAGDPLAQALGSPRVASSSRARKSKVSGRPGGTTMWRPGSKKCT